MPRTEPERDPQRYVTTLRKLLEKHGISQARLARAAGMDRSQVNHYIHARRLPTRETMERLDQAFLGVLHQRAQINVRRKR